MPYSLKEAAEATGKTKPTILRAIQGHKISAIKDEHGEWSIDPAELHRVYPPLAETDTRNSTDDEAANPHEIESLKKEDLLREMLRDRDRRADDKDEVISDLRQRLDTEGEERRRTQAQLTALLTDMREKAKAEPQPEPQRRKWWQGLFG